MSPLLDLLAPLVRRFLANKLALSVSSIVAVVVAVLADVGQWGFPATLTLIALSLGLLPRERGWRRP